MAQLESEPEPKPVSDTRAPQAVALNAKVMVVLPARGTDLA